jgi:nucleotide-binding universal stress UspA family protein
VASQGGRSRLTRETLGPEAARLETAGFSVLTSSETEGSRAVGEAREPAWVTEGGCASGFSRHLRRKGRTDEPIRMRYGRTGKKSDVSLTLEDAMVILSDTSALGTLAPAVRALRANPLRRGPIVLATDGTGRDGETVLAARLIASRLDLAVEVISVIEPPPILSVDSHADAVLSSNAIDARRRTRETVVRDYVCRFSGGATPSRVHVRFGEISAEINRFAREVSATMVIVGSAPHERSGRRAAGDRAAHVLRWAPCSVLSVSPNFRRLPPRIVASVDFGPSGIRAAYAALLVIEDGGSLVLTHVRPAMPDSSDPSVAPEDRRGESPVMFDCLRNELGPFVPPSVMLETLLVIDGAVPGIVAAARHVGAEMIAVGTRVRESFGLSRVGGVPRRVLRASDRSVIAIPSLTAGSRSRGRAVAASYEESLR